MKAKSIPSFPTFYRCCEIISCIVLFLICSIAPVLAIPEGPAFPSAEWTQREATNYAKTTEAPTEQASDPAFLQRLEEQSSVNTQELLERQTQDPTWTSACNLCATWAGPCCGDPYRYPGIDPFYENEGIVISVVYYDTGVNSDNGGARLSGRVWAPKAAWNNGNPEKLFPGVVIITGSVQAPEPMYWWFAQALVRSGYVVMTFDVRGQGRSDAFTPAGDLGSNENSSVFATNLIDTIDFFLSAPDKPYSKPYGSYLYNPFWNLLDRDRIGIAGHSLGAAGVSVVQGINPWPTTGGQNPVDAIVAWDGNSMSSQVEDVVGENPISDVLANNSLAGFDIIPRVPAMFHSSEYGLTPVLKTMPPDPEGRKGPYNIWKEAGVPVYQLTIQGSTHFEWSLIPTFPATSWKPGRSSDDLTNKSNGWGNPLAEHYSLAWLDRWLKLPGEPGYEDADARLLADEDWVERYSFYYRSARSFPDQNGDVHECEDIRAGDCWTIPNDSDEKIGCFIATVQKSLSLNTLKLLSCLLFLACLVMGIAWTQRRRNT